MSRYDPPDPKCHHVPAGRVTAGSLDGPHASTYVCDRPACIEDAKEWAYSLTHMTAVFIPKGQPDPVPVPDTPIPSLFD